MVLGTPRRFLEETSVEPDSFLRRHRKAPAAPQIRPAAAQHLAKEKNVQQGPLHLFVG
jgi:hypothetical protein